jgi:hypothetical protein
VPSNQRRGRFLRPRCLTDLFLFLQNLTEQISSKQLSLRQVNDEAGNLTNSPIVVTECEDVNKALAQLNSKWSTLQSRTKEASEKIQQFAENYAIFSGNNASKFLHCHNNSY